MVKKSIVIVGAGGLGRELYTLIQALSEWRVEGFYDDKVIGGAGVIDNVRCLGPLQKLIDINEATNVLVGIGDPATKKRIVELLSVNPCITFPSLIHPTVVIGDRNSVVVGPGSVITAHVSITTNVVLGDHVLVNLNATIGHDCVVEKFSSIMPGVNISGSVHVGEATLIGSGAIILNGLSVGAGAIVGAGAVVTKNVQKASRVKGVPARPY